ncbi:orotate phosphoribosyltransferase [Mesoterricola silvestris]|uniref:Orotate phosphoribosyltransferase n=1 Tax=Mesoterricola silvestris TaxID=2927979 RepID=A0AA48GKB8_9BACT|nr:orotate phosphoribosyltransferase [Mesoterricola silvestris]BDU74621.1 orotate phosphoribosyltransferase [Mesoterricola silvestris]
MLDLAAGLLDAGAVRLSPRSPFTWASGLRSPIYCDNRQLLGFPDLRSRIRKALAEAAAAARPTLVAGTSTAGIAWAALVADELGLPMAYVRPEPKKHGMGRQVEGPHTDGHRVVLIEDLISTGGSSIKCVEALRHEDAQVTQVLALFSYGLPQADAAFRDAGVELKVLATFPELAARAQEKGILDARDMESLKEWRADTVAWSKRHE